MDTLEYVRLANKAPTQFVGTEVSIEEFTTALRDSIIAIRKLTEIKKQLFDNSKIERKGFFNNCSEIPARMGNYDDSARMISAILNIAQSAEHLLSEMEFAIKGNNLDHLIINVACMHLFQNLAVISKQIDKTFEEIQIGNIECLKFEHPDCFKPRTQRKELTLMDMVEHEY